VRRVAVLLVAAGVAACAAPGAPSRAVAVTAPSECKAPIDPSRPQYVVGYGSLMQDESRKRTSPQAGPAHPIEVQGYRRGWFERGSPVGFSTTYLGIVQDRESRMNAVMYQIQPAELADTDARERSYCREAVALRDVKLLDPSFSPASGAQVWIYVTRGASVALPSAQYPIVQSYVDIFLSGCLEQEQRFGVAGFARQCIATTTGWSEHWVNDRIYPRRPFAYQPRAREIDTLLSNELPRYFSHIRLEP
jgi:gamma-glutamyl AIG2-like cyclotransferase